jgi:hypothetical protein
MRGLWRAERLDLWNGPISERKKKKRSKKEAEWAGKVRANGRGRADHRGLLASLCPVPSKRSQCLTPCRQQTLAAQHQPKASKMSELPRKIRQELS